MEQARVNRKWYHGIGVVLLMLFVVAGPLALPLLWTSPRFPRWAKLGLTLAMIGYTWWLMSLIAQAVQVALQHFNSLNATFP